MLFNSVYISCPICPTEVFMQVGQDGLIEKPCPRVAHGLPNLPTVADHGYGQVMTEDGPPLQHKPPDLQPCGLRKCEVSTTPGSRAMSCPGGCHASRAGWSASALTPGTRPGAAVWGRPIAGEHTRAT